jgi:hypothetical protein
LSFNTPIIFIVYKRLETTKKVFDKIKAIRPSKLYIVADGPKISSEKPTCSAVKSYIEENIDWECQLIKIYSDYNLGCARRVQSGLDKVFSKEEKAIILEDDTLPDLSFFKFCEELLERFKNDDSVAHISGCNLQPNAVNFHESYCFSSIVNIWGWATWRRAWRNFDLNMSSWEKEDQESLLINWCTNKREMFGKKKMFDLHCNNPDPWTWDYQWVYSCWKHNALSIIPRNNLVTNIGIGPEASNTKSKISIDMYPKVIQSIDQNLIHPQKTRNISFEKKYYRAFQPKVTQLLKQKVKNLLNF